MARDEREVDERHPPRARITEHGAQRMRLRVFLRLRGDLQRVGPAADAAAQSYREAILLAHDQQARSLELRAATALARLLRDQGCRADACDLLAPIYGWFTEGFDTPDLKDAKALLDELDGA